MARYSRAMFDDSVRPATVHAVEADLRARIVRDEAMAGTVVPILRHLLANDDNSIFSDEIVARVRGMLSDVAHQLFEKRAKAFGATEHGPHEAATITALCESLIESSALLCHVHALALEWQLTERLQTRLALDPVLPPLVQALIASPEPATAEHAMRFLAAQVRFGQAQRRMRLPLYELPGDLLHVALNAMRTLAGPEADNEAAAAEAVLRADYDESRSRLGMISRLVTGMGGGAIAALSIRHGGVAVFLSALAISSGQNRDVIALSTNEARMARFAVALRAAGLKPTAIAEQFLAILPDVSLPDGLDRLGADRAAAILAVAGGSGC